MEVDPDDSPCVRPQGTVPQEGRADPDAQSRLRSVGDHVQPMAIDPEEQHGNAVPTESGNVSYMPHYQVAYAHSELAVCRRGLSRSTRAD